MKKQKRLSPMAVTLTLGDREVDQWIDFTDQGILVMDESNALSSLIHFSELSLENKRRVIRQVWRSK